VIDLALGRLDDKRGWWMKVDPNGQKALTLWRVLGRGAWRGEPIAWLELAIYGAGGDIALQLLARKVVVPLSKANPPVEVEAPAPPHMLEALAACGFGGDPRRAGEAEGASEVAH
jgi:tRNA pseudouridine32 synthase/23S rRNA pseudouridine746 synthase